MFLGACKSTPYCTSPKVDPLFTTSLYSSTLIHSITCQSFVLECISARAANEDHATVLKCSLWTYGQDGGGLGWMNWKKDVQEVLGVILVDCWLSRPWRSLHGIVGRLHLVTRSHQQTNEVWDSIQTATAQTKSSL